MPRIWTEAQNNAISIKDKTLLVSAAAGSGKTATLTERIIRRITDQSSPADISKMLIVTFTRAAAAELKVKIFSALSDAVAANPSNKHLASQLMKIGSAKICTIDSFYFDLIQSNLSALGYSSSPRIADETEYQILARGVMENTVSCFYDSEECFPRLVECFVSMRQAAALPDIFLNIYKKLEALPEGIMYLKTFSDSAFGDADKDFFKTSTFGAPLMSDTAEAITHYRSILSASLSKLEKNENAFAAYSSAISEDITFCEKILNELTKEDCSYHAMCKIFENFVPAKLSSLKSQFADEVSVFCKELHSEFKGAILTLREKSYSMSDDEISYTVRTTALYADVIYRLLSMFECEIEKEKKHRSMLTFDDIRKLTFKLLVGKDNEPTAIALQYREQFSDIFIDEYQDVDEVQDLIFSAIAKPTNRFMVGDIKQSIYEFRGTNPDVFSRYRNNFPLYSKDTSEDVNSYSIFMSNNFRCDKSIIDFTNLVCSKLFSKASEKIGYTENDNLKFSKIIDNKDHVAQKVKIAVVKSPTSAEKQSDDNLVGFEAHDYEAEYIAREIEQLLKNGTKNDGSRILPSDIVVMFRSKTIAPYIEDALARRGILYSFDDANQYFESPDVLTVLCILNAVDNPERDIYLAGALKSPIFDFSLDELIKLRKAYGEEFSLYSTLCNYISDFDDELSKKCRAFNDTLGLWQYHAAALPIDKFLEMLFDSPEFLSSGIMSIANNEGEGGNLLLLYDYARKFESGSFKGLYQFIEYINTVIDNGKTLPLGGASESKGRVSLMTIHKSKGLEFPVCFLCNTAASITSKDIKESFVLDKAFGIGMKLSESTGMALIDTPIRRTVISQIIARQAEEEMRILYVALTRARERLYISASTTKDPELFISELQSIDIVDRYTILKKSKSYLDWILLSCKNQENPTYEFKLVPLMTIEDADTPTKETENESFCVNKELEEKIKRTFNFKYEYGTLSGIPSKISVSRLYPDVLDQNYDSLELFVESKPAEVPEFFSGISRGKVSSAERGTMTHLFLQFCDFQYACKHGATEELHRLIHKGFLPKNASEFVYVNELEQFIGSDLFKKIISADRVIREQRFNLKLSADSFTQNDELLEKMQGEGLAVQGVIDLILINPDQSISLIDYKTDRLFGKELTDKSLAKKKMQERHGLQLSYYAKAAELLFGKPCSYIAVYSTHSSELYEIDAVKENPKLF